MVLDLTSLLSGEKSSIDIDFSLPLDFSGTNDVALYHVTFPQGAFVRGKVSDNAGYIHLVLTVSAAYEGECARCLSPVAGTLEYPFERTAVAEGTLENADDSGDEYVIIKNGLLDIDEELYESVGFEFPQKLLCSEECRGLCPECGKNLNEGDCGCRAKKSDPRWDILKQLDFEEKK